MYRFFKKNQKIGIIADYDVDGSTSVSILYKFLKTLPHKLFVKYLTDYLKVMDQIQD